MTHQLQVVIADNNAMDNISYINYLSQHNMQVTYTHSLSKLKKILQVTKIDILLLNLKHPEGEVMSFLKNMEFQPTMGVIVFTNENDVNKAILALEYGADDFIRQFETHNEVITRIQNLYRRIYKNNVSFPTI